MAEERDATQHDEHDEDDHCWMSPEQLAQCARADVADTFGSPVPTQMVPESLAGYARAHAVVDDHEDDDDDEDD